jgi:hypothetical protein
MAVRLPGGLYDCIPVGVPVRPRDRIVDGVVYALVVGISDGMLDGLAVGQVDGLWDGLLDGLPVGLSDGLPVALSGGPFNARSRNGLIPVRGSVQRAAAGSR